MGATRTDYETVAASQTDQVLGPTAGKKGSILERLVIVPATTSPGAVSIKDGAGGSAITVFPGGASSVADLKPIEIDLGMLARTAIDGGWRVTTGTNVSAIGIGRFAP